MSHGADFDEIRAVVAASAGPSDPSVLACEQIFAQAIASATTGIWRFANEGWSVVLKVLRHQAGGSPSWRSGEDEKHWYYWRREALAYSSGLLARRCGRQAATAYSTARTAVLAYGWRTFATRPLLPHGRSTVTGQLRSR